MHRAGHSEIGGRGRKHHPQGPDLRSGRRRGRRNMVRAEGDVLRPERDRDHVLRTVGEGLRRGEHRDHPAGRGRLRGQGQG